MKKTLFSYFLCAVSRYGQLFEEILVAEGLNSLDKCHFPDGINDSV
jgi:hypothetical protein